MRGTIALLILFASASASASAGACGTFLPEPNKDDPSAASDAGVVDGSTDLDSGVLVDDASGDGGAAADDACAACERVVFATNQQWYPDQLGAIDGGRDKCNAVASSAGAHARVKGRKFLPWLSVAGSSPSKTMVHGTGPYVLPSGKRIADDWSDLTDGTLAAAIKETEDGGAVDGYGIVWTGTDLNGNATGLDCSGWTSTGGQANVGEAFLTDGGWTRSNDADKTCDENHRIYCFEE